MSTLMLLVQSKSTSLSHFDSMPISSSPGLYLHPLNLPRSLPIVNNSSLASTDIKNSGSKEFGSNQLTLKLIMNHMESTKHYLESSHRRNST